jgi:C1A family cysteine protease
LDNLREFLYALAEGFPFIFGFSVYDSFESQEVSRTGIVPLPRDSESFLGGHAVLAVGYDQIKRHFIVRNSWGEWGDKGYCYMPFSYLTNPGLASDFWVIHTANV